MTPPRPRVVWIDFPEELRHLCEPYLERELSLLPAWVVELHVHFDPSDSAGMLSQVHPEYRNGRIWFCGQWFCGTDAYRRSSIRHEFIHFAHEPLSAFCRILIDTFSGDDRLQGHLKEQLRVALEMSTSDVEEMLTAALLRASDSPKSAELGGR